MKDEGSTGGQAQQGYASGNRDDEPCVAVSGYGVHGHIKMIYDSWYYEDEEQGWKGSQW